MSLYTDALAAGIIAAAKAMQPSLMAAVAAGETDREVLTALQVGIVAADAVLAAPERGTPVLPPDAGN